MYTHTSIYRYIYIYIYNFYFTYICVGERGVNHRVSRVLPWSYDGPEGPLPLSPSPASFCNAAHQHIYRLPAGSNDINGIQVVPPPFRDRFLSVNRMIMSGSVPWQSRKSAPTETLEAKMSSPLFLFFLSHGSLHLVKHGHDIMASEEVRVCADPPSPFSSSLFHYCCTLSHTSLSLDLVFYVVGV